MCSVLCGVDAGRFYQKEFWPKMAKSVSVRVTRTALRRLCSKASVTCFLHDVSCRASAAVAEHGRHG